MLQIYVYDDAGNKYNLDLYREEPLKLTISAEELKDIPRVNSAFSKQFRIPATQNNSKVFKWWYEVNTVDFDITQRVAAEIFVDGEFYKSGHIRIEKAYVNHDTTQIDLEIVFFGETRDFASQLGEINMNRLQLQDLNHDLTIANVEASWDLNLKNGDIVYAVANRGNDYDDTGAPTNDTAEVASQSHHTYSFQKNAHPLLTQQLTPMIKVKAIIDAIFAQTDYNYTSNSYFNTALFGGLYTDGVPDASDVIKEAAGTFEAHSTGQLLNTSIEFVEFDSEISDLSNSFYNYQFLPPADGDYTFDNNVNLYLGRGIFNPSPDYRVVMVQGSTILYDSGTISAPSGIGGYFVAVPFAGTYTLDAFTGSNSVNIQVTVTNSNGNNQIPSTGGTTVPPTKFHCTGFVPASGSDPVVVNTLLKYDVKCIDFLKSILTKFKLIMVPSPDNEFEFEIQPWVEYMGSGAQYDWTEKLDGSKDVQLQPIFFEQSQIIDFKDQSDEDFINKDFEELNGRGYGELRYDSQSDMLTDIRNITTVFAPTPVETVEGFPDTSDFVIPILCKRGDEPADHGNLQVLPIKPKPRLLFYNGKSATLPATEEWRLSGDGGGSNTLYNYYPRFTQSSTYPSSASSLNLNWFRDTPIAPATLNLGESVYERYWNKYISELYSPFARVYTGYFNIDAQDIRPLEFKDIIFVQNAWYRVLKIYDAPLTANSLVKVDLVKILETIVYVNTGDPTPGGGGIDDIVVTGGGGGSIDLTGTWGNTDVNYGDEDNYWGGGSPLVYYFYNVQTCINPGDTYVTKHTLPLAIGDAVKMSGSQHVDICYQIVSTATGPEETVVLETFPDCFSCNQ